MDVILGIDPGTKFMGVGVIQEQSDELVYIYHQRISVPTKLSFENKLHHIDRLLNEILIQYKPKWVVVEKVFLGKNVDSAFKLAHVRGVCFNRAAHIGAEIIEVSPKSMKKSITGNGNAQKEEVSFIIKNHLQITSTLDVDCSDALGMAMFFAQEQMIQRKLRESV